MTTDINERIRQSEEAEIRRLSKLARSALVREYLTSISDTQRYVLAYDAVYESELPDAELRRAILK